jgi:hypothetical protein
MIHACRAFVLALTLASPALAQGSLPRTAWGAPDLQAVWSNLTLTPLERAPVFDSLTTSPESAARFEASSRTGFLDDESDGVGGRQSEWWELGTGMMEFDGVIRTSLVVTPANGRLPYSEAGRARLAAAQRAVLSNFDGPEIRPSPERCLTGGSGATGAPFFMARYNPHYRLVQTRDHLVIAMEQNGNVRIIPIAETPAPPFRRWMGTSWARWEGDTLVVETSGFMPGDAFKPASPILVSENARVIERFTRLSDHALLYEFSVEDPDVFSETWSVQHILSATNAPMYEYACHENNHSLPNILLGARVREQAAAQ